MINIGINGFGRIGRQVFKIINQKYSDVLKVTAVNDIAETQTLIHLLKYDSLHGKYEGISNVSDNKFYVNGNKVSVFSGSSPSIIPWEKEKVDIVIESTPIFRDKKSCMGHVKRGVKKVLISSPSKDADTTLVLGVNEKTYSQHTHDVISNASCTTNALAPVVKVINESFGLVKGMMTTIHSYTSDQRILDLPHKDIRRSRAAALNIIPTTTGATSAIGKVLPELKGKLSGISIRVPTPVVSLLDLSIIVEKTTSADAVNKLFKDIAKSDKRKILGYSDEKLVSSDYRGTEYSVVIDGPSTEVLDGNMIKIIAWYDNEWGYSTRLADMTAFIAGKLEGALHG